MGKNTNTGVTAHTNQLESRIQAAITEMGLQYLCHPGNRVERKDKGAGMPTTHTLESQQESLRKWDKPKPVNMREQKKGKMV